MDDETIAGIESALHSLARRLKQARLHEFARKQAGVDVDQGEDAISRFLVARHRWLTALLADWPREEQCEFAA